MASSIKIARAQTALLLCLPVAILIGYLAGRSDAVEQRGDGRAHLWGCCSRRCWRSVATPFLDLSSYLAILRFGC